MSILLVGKEVCRQSREVVRTSIGVPLTPRPIEFQDNDRSAPCLRSRPTSDVVDGSIDGSVPLKGSRRVPKVKRESEIFTVQALSKHYALRETVGKEHLKNRDGAGSMRRS